MDAHKDTRLSDEKPRTVRLPRCYHHLLAEQASWSDYRTGLGEISASGVDRLLVSASGLTARHLMAVT